MASGSRVGVYGSGFRVWGLGDTGFVEVFLKFGTPPHVSPGLLHILAQYNIPRTIRAPQIRLDFEKYLCANLTASGGPSRDSCWDLSTHRGCIGITFTRPLRRTTKT